MVTGSDDMQVSKRLHFNAADGNYHKKSIEKKTVHFHFPLDSCFQLQYIGKGAFIRGALRLCAMHCCASNATIDIDQ